MKKSMILFGMLSIGLAHAQQGRTHAQHSNGATRVGINTEKPVASFEISKVSSVPATQVQGFLLPHLSQTERNAMQKEALTNGIMIFNTTKNCIDWWDGAYWQCTDSSAKDEHGEAYAKYKATFSYTSTATFTKNNCTIGQEAGTISYTNPTPIVREGVSNISREDARRKANELALAEFNRLGQEEANRRGICRNVYRATVSYTHTAEFTKNNCTASQIGSKVSYTNPTPIVGTATSYVSQADADKLARENAIAEFNRAGQEEANRRGTCKEDVFASCRSMFNNSEGKIVVYSARSVNGIYVDRVYKQSSGSIDWDKISEELKKAPKGILYTMAQVETDRTETKTGLGYSAVEGVINVAEFGNAENFAIAIYGWEGTNGYQRFNYVSSNRSGSVAVGRLINYCGINN